MKPRKATYLVHRWIALLVSVQLLAWSLGGLVFSVLDIRAVRGELDSPMISAHQLDPSTLASLPDHFHPALADEAARLASLELVDRGLGPHWEAREASGELLVRLDLDGRPTGRISSEHARSLALRDFAHDSEVARSWLVETSPPTEYRGRPLPAYGVELDHPKRPHIYIDAMTGEITARRNRSWRVFDFFWMLHTMDYAGRDNFNHPLLTAASLLAIATSASGISLWAWRAARIMGRRKGRSNLET